MLSTLFRSARRLTAVGAIVALGAVTFASPGGAATATSTGLMTVTTSAPDTANVGTPIVVTVSVTNNTAAPLAQVSGTLMYARNAFQVKRLSSSAAGAICEKATFQGSRGFAACGNVTLAPGATIVTTVTLQPLAAGVPAVGAYGFTVVSDPIAHGVSEVVPGVVINVSPK
jgi:hypothetical protein